MFYCSIDAGLKIGVNALQSSKGYIAASQRAPLLDIPVVDLVNRFVADELKFALQAFDNFVGSTTVFFGVGCVISVDVIEQL